MEDRIVVIYNNNKVYTLLDSREINSWKIRVCSQRANARYSYSSPSRLPLMTFIETVEFGNSTFCMERIDGQSIEEAIATIYANVEKFQITNAMNQLSYFLEQGKHTS